MVKVGDHSILFLNESALNMRIKPTAISSMKGFGPSDRIERRPSIAIKIPKMAKNNSNPLDSPFRCSFIPSVYRRSHLTPARGRGFDCGLMVEMS